MLSTLNTATRNAEHSLVLWLGAHRRVHVVAEDVDGLLGAGGAALELLLRQPQPVAQVLRAAAGLAADLLAKRAVCKEGGTCQGSVSLH